jgi:two-component system response regulator HydG
MDRARLLVIDPDPSARATLAMMLGALGYDLIDELSPEAMDQMPANRPGLILLGLDLAGADALALLSSTHRKYPSTPVVLLAAANHPGPIRLALRLGASAVLRFPLPASQLQATLVQALGTTDACLRLEAKRKDVPTMRGGASSDQAPVESDQRDDPAIAQGASFNESHVESEWTAEAPLGAAEPLLPLRVALEGPEREIILQALRACGWSRNETARALEINRSTLHKKMKKHRLFDAN